MINESGNISSLGGVNIHANTPLHAGKEFPDNLHPILVVSLRSQTEKPFQNG